jgi:DNA polymerase
MKPNDLPMTAMPVHRQVMHCDIETYSEASLSDAGAYRYAEDPTTELLLFAYTLDDESIQVIDLTTQGPLPGSIINSLLDPLILKLAHNASFERVVLSHYLMRLGRINSYLPPEDWGCTMNMANHLALAPSLEKLGEVVKLPEGLKKDAAGKRLIGRFCQPCRPTKANGMQTRNTALTHPEDWQNFAKYNQQDVLAEVAVYKRMSPFPLSAKEHRIAALDARINDRGLMLDSDLYQAAIELGDLRQEQVHDEIVKMTGISNPKSHVQLKEWFEVVEGRPVESLEKKEVPRLLKEFKTDIAKQVLNLRSELAKSSLKKYERMAACVMADHRTRGTFQYLGANRTGRWAGRGIQPHNFPRNNIDQLDFARQLVKEKAASEIEFYFGSVTEVLSQVLRTAIVAPDRFVIADLSAIESRVISWLASETWREEIFRGDGKIYEATAERMFSLPKGSVDKSSPYRSHGKTAELSLAYGGGINALIKYFEQQGIDHGLSDDELDAIVSNWRKANPKIVSFWHDLQRAAKSAIESRATTKVGPYLEVSVRSGMLLIRLPSGRYLHYAKPRLGMDERGRQNIYFQGVKDRTWQNIKTWGGTLAENVVQAVARDVLSEGLLRADASGLKIVGHVHDEIIVESDSDNDLKILESAMADPIDWAPGLPLAVEGFCAPYYMKA